MGESKKVKKSRTKKGEQKEKQAGKRSKLVPIVGIAGGIILCISSHLVLQWYKDDQTFVSRERVQNVSKTIRCSNDYAQEENLYPDCLPHKCGRYASDDLVTEEEVGVLLEFAVDSIQLAGSSGGASILDLHSGALSKGEKFVDFYQLKSEVLDPKIIQIYSNVRVKIQEAISSHFEIDVNSLHLTHPTFFSRITSRPARTVHDEYWHPHVDKKTYGSFHYTSLLYLTDYGLDFEGGRFVFMDDQRNSTVEPRRGRVLAFTSGSENVHFVEKVESGTRYAMTVSFTCDPSKAINDPVQR